VSPILTAFFSSPNHPSSLSSTTNTSKVSRYLCNKKDESMVDNRSIDRYRIVTAGWSVALQETPRIRASHHVTAAPRWNLRGRKGGPPQALITKPTTGSERRCFCLKISSSTLAKRTLEFIFRKHWNTHNKSWIEPESYAYVERVVKHRNAPERPFPLEICSSCATGGGCR
jgi:hypothetical protein